MFCGDSERALHWQAGLCTHGKDSTKLRKDCLMTGSELSGTAKAEETCRNLGIQLRPEKANSKNGS